MKSHKNLGLAVIALILLSACGQRGPLYLPSEAPQNQPPQTPDSQPNSQPEG
ncbi:lipoprotein [Glaciecola sp. XM2]|uniref:LPS translocon maturation chaperone LptM n=1 Tax=Glaciecola sp. XM2 TaxID=1914931 RepID=UPI001BDDFDCA|nr:lipoprotein [Glaciecola sp. XM2]MBT1451730.1 lipoprotein [Glaciecola sp. XM2]